MTEQRGWRMLLRSGAFAIAILGVVDPHITSPRPGKPTVAVVALDAIADRERAKRVAAVLEDDFTVIASPWALADATVLVGQAFNRSDVPHFQHTLVVIGPDRDDAPLRITSVSVPRDVMPSAPVRVSVTMEVADTTLRTADVVLYANGGTADSVRAELAVGSDGNECGSACNMYTVVLTLVPSAPGDLQLEVIAHPVRSGDQTTRASNPNVSSRASALTTVRDIRRRVLVYDTRPSFMSTFVRRTLEQDPRFDVASRIVTSRDISTATGAPPAQLTARDALEAYDLIVVGAPDALSAASVQTMERYLRETGGSVLLLLDTPVSGAMNNLLRVSDWRTRSVDQGAVVRSPDFAPLTLWSAEHYWPAVLPAEARVIALAAASRKDSLVTGNDAAPLLWQTPVGLGSVFVSGALDAWRFRDAERSDFADFWPQLAFDAASRAVSPIAVSVEQPVLAPGERTVVEVLWRAGLTQRSSVEGDSLSAVFETVDSSGTRTVPINLFASGSPVVFRGVLRAPEWPGLARVVVTAGNHRAALPVAIDRERARIPAGGEPLLRDWARARGGWAMLDAQLPRLADSLKAALTVQPTQVRWHPMRSVWWLLPFVLALSGEWWLRRRGGLA